MNRTYSRRALLGGLRLVGAAGLALPLGGIASLEALFAPKAKLWARWQAHDPASKRQIDHSAWNRLLASHVHADPMGVNRVDYRALAKMDRPALEAYVEMLSAIAVDTLSQREQLAFWINLYNALTVRTIVRHYPVATIRDIDISPGLLADGPWDKALVSVMGEPVTLNDIEHRILRPIWREPRIHYALNCAALGCPNLQRSAFTADNCEALLESAARDFVNSQRGVTLDRGRLIVSSIYVWFQEDFGGGDDGVIDHLQNYAAPALAAALDGKTALAGHRYDWRLNEGPKPPA